MTHLRRTLTFGLLAALAFGLAACGGGTSGTTDATGRISLGISDGPVHDADKVCVAFNQIEFKGAGESVTTTLDPVQSVNLLEFQGDNAAPLLFNHELPAGDYQWMRLGVDAVLGDLGGLGDPDPTGSDCFGDKSYMTMNSGSIHNLYVPSGAQSGLKLVGGFTVPAGGFANFTAEFDLMKSVTAPRGLEPDVVLRPTIRLVNNVEVGTLTGEVSSGLATGTTLELPSCDASVYVFADGVTPNPIGTDPATDPDGEMDPIATAMVNEHLNDLEELEYHYTVGFLLAGNYEVAFTCDGETFVPVDGKPAEIFVNQLTEVPFL